MTLLLSVLIDCQKYCAALSLILCQHLLLFPPSIPLFFIFAELKESQNIQT